MKQILFFILCILNFTNITYSRQDPNSTYFNAQQFFNLITSPEFLKNPKKWDRAKIICCNCNDVTTSDKLWAYGMAYGEDEILQELLSIFNNGSTQD